MAGRSDDGGQSPKAQPITDYHFLCRVAAVSPTGTNGSREQSSDHEIRIHMPPCQLMAVQIGVLALISPDFDPL